MTEPVPYNEKALLLRITAGDEQAFAELVNKYWRNIYLHALTYTRKPQQAEEITQDVLLGVWHKRDKLKEVDNFTRWLHVVARNKIISALRVKLQQLSSLDEAATSDDLLEYLLVPDRQAEFREAYQVLLKGIEQLPEKRKEIFKMSRLEGLSNQEIADQLQIHPVTVSQYLSKALIFLKSYLHEHQIDTITTIILLGGVT